MERSNADCEDTKLEIYRKLYCDTVRRRFAGMEGAHDKKISGRFEG